MSNKIIKFYQFKCKFLQKQLNVQKTKFLRKHINTNKIIKFI